MSDQAEKKIPSPQPQKTSEAVQSENIFSIGFADCSGSQDSVLIAAKKDGQDVKGVKDANDSRETQKIQEKPTPPEGVSIPFQDFIRTYKAPFVDAYWHSKALKDGPGKSKTYEQIIEALDSSPWKKPNELKIKFDRNAKDTFYDAGSSTLIMKTSDSPDKQIEHVAHEGYHATHQGLKKLWFEGTQAHGIESFVKIKEDLEVQSFVTEIQVHNDITKHWKSTEPVTYIWKKGNDEIKTDLGTLYDPAHPNTDKLRRFLMFDATTQMKINGVQKSAAYDEYYRSSYSAYKIGWRSAHADLLTRYKQDPDVKAKMDTMKDF